MSKKNGTNGSHSNGNAKAERKPAKKNENVTVIAIKVWKDQASLLREAGMNVGVYVRDTLVPQAAAKLGKSANFPPMRSRGAGSAVKEAAAKLGMTTSEFRKHAVQLALASASA